MGVRVHFQGDPGGDKVRGPHVSLDPDPQAVVTDVGDGIDLGHAHEFLQDGLGRSLEELVPNDPQNKVPLANWQTLTELALSPSLGGSKPGQPAPPEGKPWSKPTEAQVRNLRWEGGEYKAGQAKSAVLSEAEHRKSFNEAIRKSLEQEKLDKK